MAAKPVKKSDQDKPWNKSKKMRSVEVRALRKYYLIVCEGEKTEPNYFEGFKQDLPRNVLQTCEIKIEGTGFNTKSLLQNALRLKSRIESERMQPIDKLWLVLDRDSFAANDFNTVVIQCREQDIGCAWSNEAFELWYLLHFKFQNTGISRKQYWPALTDILKSFLGDKFKYKKGDPQLYSYLKKYGNQEKAIAWAKKLAERRGDERDYAHQNPRTQVYELVEELLDLNT